jgi:SAM-dependent methyltransferase
MRRRKPKLGQYANVDLRAYLTSVGALRHEQSSKILAFLAPHVRPGARVLDVGCGFGSFLLRAKEAGYAVAGIEPDEHACALACDALGSDVVKCGTLQQVSLPAGSADVVATLDVLEHVAPAEQARSLARWQMSWLPVASGRSRSQHRGLVLPIVRHGGACGSANWRHVDASALAD